MNASIAVARGPRSSRSAVVVVLSIGMLGVDLVIDQHDRGSHDGAGRELAALGRARRRPALPGVSAVDREPRSPEQIAVDRRADRRRCARVRSARDRRRRGATSGRACRACSRTSGTSSRCRRPARRELVDARSRRRSRTSSRSTRTRRVDGARRDRATSTRAGSVIDVVVGVLTLVLRHARSRSCSSRALRRQRALVGDAPRDARRARARARGVRVADRRTISRARSARCAATPTARRCTDRRGRARSARRIRRARRSDDRHHRRSARARRSTASRRPARSRVTPVVLELLDELRGELARRRGRRSRSATAGPRARRACSAQVLRNLITNAAKYRAPDRQLALRDRGASDGDRVEIACADNGIGHGSRRSSRTRSSRSIARRGRRTGPWPRARRSSSARSRRSAARARSARSATSGRASRSSCPRQRDYFLRLYRPVSFASPSEFARTLKPTNAAVAFAGRSSFSTLSANSMKL